MKDLVDSPALSLGPQELAAAAVAVGAFVSSQQYVEVTSFFSLSTSLSISISSFSSLF